MLSKRFVIPLSLLGLVFSVTSVWAHQGVIHADGVDLHFRSETLLVGPDQRFRVTLVHLPDVPVSGQNVQFLVRLEETLAEADPLLGGEAPLTPEFFQVFKKTRETRLSSGSPVITPVSNSVSNRGLGRFSACCSPAFRTSICSNRAW